MTTRSMSPQHLRSPMLTFATKKLSTGAHGQKENAASFFCPRSFDQAVMRNNNRNRHGVTYPVTNPGPSGPSLSHSTLSTLTEWQTHPALLAILHGTFKLGTLTEWQT